MDGDLHRVQRPVVKFAPQDIEAFEDAALGEDGDGEAAFDGGDLAGEAGTVGDDLGDVDGLKRWIFRRVQAGQATPASTPHPPPP